MTCLTERWQMKYQVAFLHNFKVWFFFSDVYWMRLTVNLQKCFHVKLVMGSVIVKHFCVVPNKKTTLFICCQEFLLKMIWFVKNQSIVLVSSKCCSLMIQLSLSALSGCPKNSLKILQVIQDLKSLTSLTKSLIMGAHLISKT